MKRSVFRLKGSSLAYSIMISMLISILLSSYLLADFPFRKLLKQQESKSRAADNLRSAINLGIGSLSSAAKRKQEYLVFGNDSLFWEQEDWGLFKLLHAQGIHAQTQYSIRALVGQLMPQTHRSLYLSDEGYPLVLLGKSQLSGNVLVPEGVVQTARFQGQTFSGSFPDRFQIGKSRKLESGDFPSLTKRILNILDSLYKTPSSHSYHHWQTRQLDNAWDEGEKVLRARGHLVINGGHYRGKIMIVATESIEVTAETILEDILLVAPTVKLQAGLQGSIQIFASDTILVGEGSMLQFPSVLALSARNKRKAYIELGPNSIIEGTVLFKAISGPQRFSNLTPNVHLDERAIIWGAMQVAGNLELEGTINGQLLTQRIVLRTTVGTLRNQLLNVQLSSDRLAPAYAGPFFYSKSKCRLIKIFSHKNYSNVSQINWLQPD